MPLLWYMPTTVLGMQLLALASLGSLWMMWNLDFRGEARGVALGSPTTSHS